MTHRIRITRLTRHEGDVFTANVTAAGSDTVQVDNSIGCWTLPLEAGDLGARILRREILPWVVKLLNDRVRGFLRGEPADESEVEIDAGGGTRHTRRPARKPEPEEPPSPKPPSSAEAIARAMAQAGSSALKEAA